MSQSNFRLQIQRKQSGFVLILAMLMLLGMAILGISGASTGLLAERNTGNYLDRILAFESSEAMLRKAEDRVLELHEVHEDLSTYIASVGSMRGFNATNSVSPNLNVDIASVSGLNQLTDADWTANGLTPTDLGKTNLTSVANQPRVIIASSGLARENADLNQNASEGNSVGRINWYRLTSRGMGKNGGEVILESTFAYQTER